MYKYEGEYTHYWASGDTNPMKVFIRTVLEGQEVS